MVDSETLSMRRVAFTIAQELVQPICETHPPEAYRIITAPASIFVTPASIFVTPAGSTMTPSEKVVSMTISIADWLLDA